MSAKRRTLEVFCSGKVHSVKVCKRTRALALENHQSEEHISRLRVLAAFGGDVCTCIALRILTDKSKTLKKVSFWRYLTTLRYLASRCSTAEKTGDSRNIKQILEEHLKQRG